MQKIEIINPITYPGWDDLIISGPDYSFFHSSSWARVLSESYNYHPLYFTTLEDGRLLSLIPVMEIESILTGRRGVSLPFSDYCEPIEVDRAHLRNTFTRIVEYGKKRKWKYLEIRGGKNFNEHFSPWVTYYHHTLDLSEDSGHIFSNFRDSTRRNIKKAMKEGVKVKIENSPASVKEFYQLNCLTRRYHGLPPQPFVFFKNIYEHVLSKGLGLILLASNGELKIAGAIFFHYGDRAIYKYGASNRLYQHLRPNNLLMWKAIKWYCQNGYKSISFGRTDPEDRGLLQFKSGWRPREEIIEYYKYNLTKETFTNGRPKALAFSSKKVLGILPASLLKIIGVLLYRHIG